MAKKGKKDKDGDNKPSKDKKSKKDKKKKSKKRQLAAHRINLAADSDVNSSEPEAHQDADRQLGRRLLDSALRLSLEQDDEIAKVARLVAGPAVDSLVAARRRASRREST